MKLAPSLLSADFGRLAEEVHRIEDLVNFFHFDVMDGHFVPNLTFGPVVVNALRRHTQVPFAIHLMITHPADYALKFLVGPDDCIIFHVEAADPPRDVIRTIRGLGCRVGLSLRPGTPLSAIFPYLDEVELVLVMSVEPGLGGQRFLPEAIPRIRALADEIGDRPVEIAVDGGINSENVAAVVAAGAEIIVAGTSVYGQPDPRAAAVALWKAAESTKNS